jgi:tetratricopeptide (TPR) repeat protein
MAKNKKVEETHTSIDTLNDSLTEMGAKVQANKKLIIRAAVVVVAIVAVVLIYIFAINRPAIKAADEAAGIADRELIVNGNDSLALQYYAAAAEKGKDSGNRAKLQAAIILYNQGKYAEALQYVDDYSTKDELIGAASYSLKGDCYVQLDKLSEAADAFNKAIKQSDDNAYYTPFFMIKLARVYAAQGNHAKEAELYGKIVDEYPSYVNNVNPSVKKLYRRAQIQAGK